MKFLFVCSGNICRSPMAEGLFNHFVSTHPEYQEKGLKARSAGIIGTRGGLATGEAVTVMEEKGIDITDHKSSPVNKENCEWADVILVMTEAHGLFFAEWHPQYIEKVQLITENVDEPGEIDDPIGGGIGTYRECRDYLDYLVRKIFEKADPSSATR